MSGFVVSYDFRPPRSMIDDHVCPFDPHRTLQEKSSHGGHWKRSSGVRPGLISTLPIPRCVCIAKSTDWRGL